MSNQNINQEEFEDTMYDQYVNYTQTQDTDIFQYKQEDGDLSDEPLDFLQQSPQTNQFIIIKANSEECYTCLTDQIIFMETCGQTSHQLCKQCFEKLQKMKGCPMCRNDIKGVIGKQQMLDFFNDINQQVYIHLYNRFLELSSFYCNQITFFFGDVNDFNLFIISLQERCLGVIQEICEKDEKHIKKEIQIIQNLMKENKVNLNPINNPQGNNSYQFQTNYIYSINIKEFCDILLFTSV